MKKTTRNYIIIGLVVAIGLFIFFNRYAIKHEIDKLTGAYTTGGLPESDNNYVSESGFL